MITGDDSNTTAQPPPPPAPPLDILALDDDADFREYLRGLLQSPEGGSHTVRTAATPDEFYAHAEIRLPQVAILDMKMGRHSGEQVLDEVRKRWPKLCVIVLTGYPSMESMRRALRAGGSVGGGAFDYLTKPFELEHLTTALAQAARSMGLTSDPLDRLRHELGRQIRLARTQRSWTLKDLSESSGVSVSQLSSIERGSHLPSLESLFAIAHALNARASAWMENAGA
ncbi:MAG: response regulator [Phycisphaerales bacterium]|nr:response regulator [Phycisphaerales bacterium]